MKAQVGMKIKFNNNVLGEYVTVGREYTITRIQGNTVWVQSSVGQTYVNWRLAIKYNAVELN